MQEVKDRIAAESLFIVTGRQVNEIFLRGFG
jgi:hypothetical protein